MPTTNVTQLPTIEETFEKNIELLWQNVVKNCNNILKYAEVHGLMLMEIQNPNVHDVLETLNFIIPVIDKISKSCEFSPESGMKLANIKTYTLHLKEISLAVETGNASLFESAIEKLDGEAKL